MASKTQRKTTKQIGRPVNPKYQENIRLDVPPRDVAKAIMKKPPKPEADWRYLKDKPR